MSKPVRLSAFLAKDESTYGTDPTPAAGTDGVRPAEPVHGMLTPRHEFVNAREDVISGTLVPIDPAQPAGRVCDISFRHELGGTGAAYSSSVVPQWLTLAKACGLGATIDNSSGTENIELEMQDSARTNSSTIYAYTSDLHRFVVTGARGNLVLNVTAGGLIVAEFSMMGLLAAPTDASNPSVTSYESTKPPVARGAALTVAGNDTWTPAWSDLTLDLGNSVNLIPDGNASDAVDSFQITSRSPTFSMTAQAEALSAYNPFTEFRDAVQNTIDATIGDTQYNRLDIDIDEAYHTQDPGHVDYTGGLAGWEIAMSVHDLTLILD